MSKAPANIVGIDLGNSSLKAVRLQKQGDQYVLARAAYLECNRDPVNPVLPTEQTVVAQLKEIGGLVKTSGADVHFSVNSPNSTVRYVDLPHSPLDEIRMALKLNSSTYLRQNFESYVFDVCPLDAETAEALQNKKSKKGAAVSHGKAKMLAGGIFSSEVILYYHASRHAGIKPRSLQLAPISLINGFNAAYPEIFSEQAVALLDFGFLSSSLTILDKGKPLLTRTVPIGGKHITDYIAQMLNLDFPKGEVAKLQGDPTLAEGVSRTAVTLIREVRSSINFFEKNSDQAISKVYLTGASVVSPVIVEALKQDIGTACETWDASRGLAVQLPPEQQNLFSRNTFAFSTALGVARTYAVKDVPKIKAAPEEKPGKGAEVVDPALRRSTIQSPPDLRRSTIQPPSP